jgi:hypothetical protein
MNLSVMTVENAKQYLESVTASNSSDLPRIALSYG